MLQPLQFAERATLFGPPPKFFPDPKPGNPEAVRLDQEWVRQHLVEVVVPQLARFGVRHAVTCHWKAAEPLKALWAAWEAAELLGTVKSWDGLWVCRFVRQSGTEAERAAKCAQLGPERLSNHALGTAFDINSSLLPLGKLAAPDDPIRHLVPIAEAHGWGWGGNYLTRPDPMHFELVRLPS